LDEVKLLAVRNHRKEYRLRGVDWRRFIALDDERSLGSGSRDQGRCEGESEGKEAIYHVDVISMRT
jgi:hypothetical protein